MSWLLLVLAFAPGFAWLYFYLKEDPHPEPRWLVVMTFMSGAAFAVLALALQLLLENAGIGIRPLVLISTGATTQVVIAVLVLAVIEELLKFTSAYVVVYNKPDFDEPIDAMIYMVVAALGFATLENFGAIFPRNALPVASMMFETMALRFVGATLLHTLTSSLVGYSWARTIREFGHKRHLIYGLALATILHAFFNYLIISYGNLMYTLVFVIVIGLFVLADFEKLKEKIL